MSTTSIPRTITLKGNIYATEDVTVSGVVTGDIIAEHCNVSITESAHVAGTISANDVTIAGRAEGTVLATQIVEMRIGADVHGRLLTPRVILADGAMFHGTVEPEKVEAALRVQEYRLREQANRTDPAVVEPRPL